MLSKRKWVNRCPLLETANNVTVCVCVFFLSVCQDVCLVEWRRLIIILFACWEVASIIFLGLHDKLQITKVIYATLNLFCICIFAAVCVYWSVQACAQMLVHVCEHLLYMCCKMNSTVLHIFFFSPLPFCVCDHRRWMSGRVS